MKNWIRRFRGQAPAALMLFLLGCVFSLSTPHFLTGANLMNILMQIAAMALLAIGQTFVVISGEFDLSGGSVIALVGIVCAKLLLAGAGVPVSFAAGLLLGTLLGFFNGVCVAKIGMPSFILTLAMSIMTRGIAFAISGGATLYGLPDAFNFVGSGRFGGVPVSVILILALFVFYQAVLTRTVFGYRVCAVGENPRGARLVGIKNDHVRIGAFTLAGFQYGLAAIVLTGQLGAAVSTSGEGLEMTALSCLAIGGISLRGGRGNLLGTFLGCMIIGVLTNGANMLNLSPYYTDFFRGLVIFAALAMECARSFLNKGEE